MTGTNPGHCSCVGYTPNDKFCIIPRSYHSGVIRGGRLAALRISLFGLFFQGMARNFLRPPKKRPFSREERCLWVTNDLPACAKGTDGIYLFQRTGKREVKVASMKINRSLAVLLIFCLLAACDPIPDSAFQTAVAETLTAMAPATEVPTFFPIPTNRRMKISGLFPGKIAAV
jgi:hypothetical protein